MQDFPVPSWGCRRLRIHRHPPAELRPGKQCTQTPWQKRPDSDTGKLEIFLTEIPITYLYFKNYSTSTSVPEFCFGVVFFFVCLFFPGKQIWSVQDKCRTDQTQSPSAVLRFSSYLFCSSIKSPGLLANQVPSFLLDFSSSFVPTQAGCKLPCLRGPGAGGVEHFNTNLWTWVLPCSSLLFFPPVKAGVPFLLLSRWTGKFSHFGLNLLRRKLPQTLGQIKKPLWDKGEFTERKGVGSQRPT